MPIRGLLLDYHGVVASHRDILLLQRLEREHGLEPGSLRRRVKDVAPGRAGAGKSDVRRALDGAYAILQGLPGRALPPFSAWARAQKPPRFSEENIALLRALAPAYRLSVVSNRGGDLEEKLTAYGLSGLFGAVIVSAAAGLRKPDPRIFLLAAERLGLPAAHCLVVDDKEENVRGAQSAGMAAVLYLQARGDDLATVLAAAGVRAPPALAGNETQRPQ